MIDSQSQVSNSMFSAAAIAVILLSYLIAIVLGTDALVYDEAWYVEATIFAQPTSPFAGLLEQIPGPAGPLYHWVHLLFAEITSLRAPGIRLVSLSLVLSSAVLIFLALNNKYNSSVAVAGTSILFFTPSIGMSAALAITEAPALLFASASIVGLSFIDRSANSMRPALFSGLCLALAVLGRQNYLVVWPAILLASLMVGSTLKPAVIFSIGLILPCAPVFLFWGGLTPPMTAYVGDGISLGHGLLAFGYAGLFSLWLAPRFMSIPWMVSALAFSLGFAIDILFELIDHAPGASLVFKLFGEVGLSLVRLLGPCIAGIALWFAVAATQRAFSDRSLLVVSSAFAAMFILASCAKVTHIFSVRYVTVALPFLIIVLAPHVKSGMAFYGRGLVSGLFGVIFVSNYLTPSF